MAELNRAAAKVAREAADEADRPVAGRRARSGRRASSWCRSAPSPPTRPSATFAEQAQALAEGGVDVLWIETMSAPEEVEAAVKGAATTGLPIVVTMSASTPTAGP